MSRKYSYWLDTGKYAMLQKLLSIMLGMVSFMLLARIFKPSDFGVWGLFIIISSFIETCRNALVRNGYIRFINSKPPSSLPFIESAALLTNLVFTLLLMLTLLLFGHFLGSVLRAEGLGELMQYYAAGLLLLAPFSWFENYFYSRMDFRAIFWMYLLRNASFLAVVLFYFISKSPLEKSTAVIWYSIVLLPGILVAFYFFSFHDKVKMKRNGDVLKEFLHYGKYVLGNNFFSLVFVSTDSFMTSRYVSSVALSYYGTGTRLLNFADIPSQVLGDIMFPRAAQLVATGTDTEVSRIYEKTVAASLSLILPFVLVVLLFTKPIILILVGPQYLPASPLIMLMIFYAVFLPFVKQFGNIMDAKGKPHINFWLMMIMAVFNLAANYFFIRYAGMYGSAIGTLTTYVILFIFTQVVLNRMIGISTFRLLGYIPALYAEYYRMAVQFITKNKTRNV